MTGDRVGQPTLRLIVPHGTAVTSRAARAADAAAANKPIAEVRGVNVHAQQLVDGRDRPQIERLCRTITRPPLAQERLELRADGRIELNRSLRSRFRVPTRFARHPCTSRACGATARARWYLSRTTC